VLSFLADTLKLILIRLRLLRQYLYFCTSKASKLITKAEYPPASSLQALLLLPSCPAEEVALLRRRQRAAAAAAAAPPTQKHTYTTTPTLASWYECSG
jgi:hypothetical protein